MLVPFAIPFIAGLISLPYVANARSLTVNLTIGQISPAHTELITRQAAPIDVPAQCKSTCDSVNAVIANNCTPQQCCTSTFERQYFNCFLCVGNSINLKDYSQPQIVLNEFRQQCASRGLAIAALTFPGQGASRSATSTRPSSSSRRASVGVTTISASPTLSVVSPAVSQQTVTRLSSASGDAAPTGAPAGGNSASGRYGVSCLAAVVASFVVAAWHLR
ncbi:hypothetical protein FPV67DRAFT_1469658 [Lyophyllum atratum]|nr:hypothetical protein FPV67DRAFT_1469658 [Lyophyllum atratum]